MADVTMNMKVLNLTKTTSQWAQVSSVIPKGFLCVELDTNDKSWVKIGDGVHTFAELPYITDGAVASLGSLFRIKGIKASTSELPQTGNVVGDVWFVGSASTAGSDKFEEYVWTTNSTWEFLGKISDPVIPVYTGGTGITIDSSDAINLDIASANSLGGIKVGTNLSIDSNGVLSADNTTYVFDGTYNASTNKAATVSTVTNAIGALDVPSTGTGAITGFGAGKTLATLTETDGKISATFQDISIANTQVTGLGDAAVKGVTDNSSATAVTSSDTNLITGRTLYYAGYAKDSDVVKGVTVNGTAATVTNGTAAITGVVTGMSYTNSSGTTSTLTPTNGNLDITSLTINCSL